ncbi:hypothetical protein Cgig2_032113 [Carnegiea gigantea]|uniref:Retrotransposon gag domain-containing protein n=1 Tax=Carnegiea gigantea TaxID=171969 RepID=A0A9Q1KK19_9CARY|nr:hypothetical protein Cgig2_032113 [Carnegiea gigantea]
METTSSASRQPVPTPEQLSQAIQTGVVTALQQLHKSPPKQNHHQAEGVQNQCSNQRGRACRDRVAMRDNQSPSRSVENSYLERHNVEPIPKKFPLSKMDYNETGDPEDHIAKFASIMHLTIATDVVWCKCFPTTLSRLAQQWFNSLSPNSISNFSQLVEQFTGHFISNRRREKNSNELMNIRQGLSENLRSYIELFNSEIILIPKLKQDVTVLALMSGLARGPLRDLLTKKTSNTLGEALSKANQFTQIEKFNKTAAQITGGPNTFRGKTTPHPVNDKVKKEFIEVNLGRPEKKKAQDSSRFKHYSLLNKLSEEIYQMYKNDDKWKRRKKMSNPNRHKYRWCDFHNDYGHTTAECRDLKDNLEDLMSRGYYSLFKVRSRREVACNRDYKPPGGTKLNGGGSKKGTINVIYGQKSKPI